MKRLVAICVLFVAPFACVAVERASFRGWAIAVDRVSFNFSLECAAGPGGNAVIVEDGRIALPSGWTPVSGKVKLPSMDAAFSLMEIPVARNGETNAVAFRLSADGVEIAAPDGSRISGTLLWGEDARRVIAVRADEPCAGSCVTSGPCVPDGADALFDISSDALLALSGATLECVPSAGRFAFAADGTVSFSARRAFLSRRYGIRSHAPREGGMFATPPVGWMTWYAVKFAANEQIVLENAKAFKEKFGGYTDEKPVLWVDWEWGHGKMHSFGDEDEDVTAPRASAYPRGMKALADDLSSLGFTPALWVSVVNDCRTNAFWKARPEWVLGEWDVWCGPVWGDPTAPGFCEEYVPALFALYENWGYKAFKWDTLPWALAAFTRLREKMHDPSVMPEEAYRRMVAAGRKAVGEKTFLLSCSGETDACNLAASDLFDAMRIGGDIFTWENFVKQGLDRILRYQPLHGTHILSDSDNLVLRPEFSTLAQARTRVSIYGLSGLPVTVGDTIASLDAPRIDLLRRIMPVVPVTPASLARAEIRTDCLVESVAEFARPWGTWEVRAFSNLDTNEARRVSFSASGRAVWDFWRDEQLRLDGDGAIKLEVPPCDTRVVRLTPFSAQGATLLSVSRHITQGGYELASFRSDAHEVSGAVKCPGGETVKVTLLLPGNRGAITSSHPCKLEGDVLRLELSPASSETVEWHVAF